MRQFKEVHSNATRRSSSYQSQQHGAAAKDMTRSPTQPYKKEEQTPAAQPSHSKGMTSGNPWRCYGCGETGHFKRDCPRVKPGESREKAVARVRMQFSDQEWTAEGSVEGKWARCILDSGAAITVAPRKFVKEDFVRKRQVRLIGDGSSFTVPTTMVELVVEDFSGIVEAAIVEKWEWQTPLIGRNIGKDQLVHLLSICRDEDAMERARFEVGVLKESLPQAQEVAPVGVQTRQRRKASQQAEKRNQALQQALDPQATGNNVVMDAQLLDVVSEEREG